MVMEIEKAVKEKLMNGGVKVHVISGLFEGSPEHVRTTFNEKRADEIEREVCKDMDVPFGERARERYYRNGGENEVHHQIVDLE